MPHIPLSASSCSLNARQHGAELFRKPADFDGSVASAHSGLAAECHPSCKDKSRYHSGSEALPSNGTIETPSIVGAPLDGFVEAMAAWG